MTQHMHTMASAWNGLGRRGKGKDEVQLATATISPWWASCINRGGFLSMVRLFPLRLFDSQAFCMLCWSTLHNKSRFFLDHPGFILSIIFSN